MTKRILEARLPSTDADIAAYSVGGVRLHEKTIELSEYNESWPSLFDQESLRIQQVLGPIAMRVHHVGSTSVPGLVAKPIIDIVLEVPDSSDEVTYVTPLERQSYKLHIREPDWWEHRVLKGPGADINLHVFSIGCPEVARMLKFRDHLRANISDRELYAVRKRELAARTWKYIQNYADAKTDIINAILERAL